VLLARSRLRECYKTITAQTVGALFAKNTLQTVPQRLSSTMVASETNTKMTYVNLGEREPESSLARS
jgi:hypothetical protein